MHCASSLRILSYFCAALLCFVTHASAQTAGGMDASFHPLAPETESWSRLATQADGKLLTLAYHPSERRSQFTVYRFNRDGQPDISFSGDGKVTVDMLVGTMGSGNILVDPVGRIYIGGGMVSGRRTNNAVEINQYSAWYAIARLLPDGSVDASFGVNGIFQHSLSTDDGVPDPYDSAAIGTFALLPNGNLILMGQSVWNQLAQMYQGARYPFVFARLDERGRLDARYGVNAVKTTSLNTFFFANEMYVLNDGSLIVTAHEPGGGLNIVKLAPQLNVDPSFGQSSFGQNGRVRLDYVSDSSFRVGTMAVLPDGFVFVGSRGYSDGRQQPMAFKLTANGTFDSSFGSGGFSYPPVNATSAFFSHVAVEPGGKILAAGTNYSTSLQKPLLVRLLGNGQVDGSFQQTDIPGFGNSDLDVTQEGAFLLALETVNPSISTIRKFYIDPPPRTGSLSTGQTQSFSGFHVDVLNTGGVPVDSATTSHLLGLHGYIYSQTSDRGANADVFVVASTARGLYMRTTSGAFVAWSGQVSTLVPAYENVQLTARTYVPIYGGALPFTGAYAIYLGYMRDGGQLVYIDEAAVVEITQ